MSWGSFWLGAGADRFLFRRRTLGALIWWALVAAYVVTHTWWGWLLVLVAGFLLARRMNRRARPAVGVGRRPLPRTLREQVIARDGYVCGLCGGAVDPTDVHIDHRLPVAWGGSDELNNLQVTHSRCNLRKGAREL